MSVRRTKRIIAVFGGGEAGKGEDELSLAESLGYAIAERKEILLSGGREPARAPISQRAIRGAICESDSSPWIGIDRNPLPDAGATFVPWGPGGAVLTSDLDHLRNYLEALMCDGAIAVAGEHGTRFEVASALSLGRPVAVIGRDWKRFEATPLSDDAKEWLLKSSRATYRKSNGANHSLDDRVEKCLLDEGLVRDLRYRYFALRHDQLDTDALAREVVDWVVKEVPDAARFAGTFPIGVHNHLARSYRKWLMTHAVSSSSPSEI